MLKSKQNVRINNPLQKKTKTNKNKNKTKQNKTTKTEKQKITERKVTGIDKKSKKKSKRKEEKEQWLLKIFTEISPHHKPKILVESRAFYYSVQISSRYRHIQLQKYLQTYRNIAQCNN